MNGMLRLAAQHIEQIADPKFGLQVNELRAVELSEALRGDDRLIPGLVPDDEDALVLSPLAWAWMLPVLVEMGLRVPDTVLDATFDRTASPFVRLRVVQVATAVDADGQAWLLRRVDSAAESAHSGQATTEAIVLGQLLLQVGNEPARLAFLALVRAAPPQVGEILSQIASPEAPGYRSWFAANNDVGG